MFKRVNAIIFLAMTTSLLLAGPAIDVEKPDATLEALQIFRANEYQMDTRTPAPAWDTNRVWLGATANLTRKVAVGTNFKGSADDTIRIVTVQSGGTLNLVIATDTTSSAFGKGKFRIETPYAFAASTPHAVAVGNVDGDQYTDILAAYMATPFRLIWFEWDGAAWAARDSFAVNAAINDITIGDADNNGVANEIFINIAQTSPNSAIMRAVWNGATWDTTRILFSGTIAMRGVAIGDVQPDLAGNEVYAVGSSRIHRAYWNGVSWDTASVVPSGISAAYDVVIGDINPLTPGNEICVVHGSTSYQVSVWTWTGTIWSGTLWALTATWGTLDNDIAIGNVLTDNPGSELIVTSGSSATAWPRVFWYAPDGRAWASSLPKTITGQNDYGVAIGNVNRFRTMNQEFVLTGGGSLVEGEQYDFVNDVGTYFVTMKNPTSIMNKLDTVNVTIFNSGSSAQTGFTVGYRFKTSPLTGSVTYSGTLNSGTTAVVKVPVTMNFLGWDTLYAFTNLAGDANAINDTTRLHIEVYDDSTMAASGFNSTVFPPQEWARTILVGAYNWTRYTAGTYPTCTPLEGVAMTGYPSFNATGGSQSRLRTHKFNIGPAAKKVMLRFYMYGDPGYAANPDSVIVEYSDNDVTYNYVTAFHRYNAVAGWYVHDVEIGDFPSNKELYIGFRAWSGYGNNMFVDSVRIFVTAPTAAATDAGVQSIDPFPIPHFVGDTLDVTVTIRNYGLSTLTTTPVFYTLGAADTVNGTWSGSLQINETAEYTFTTKFVPAQSGEDTLYAGTKLPGDQNPANDTTHLAFVTCPYSNIPPYAKDFDEEWSNSTNPPFCGWSIVDGGTQTPNIVDNNDWHRYYDSTHGSNLARIYFSPVEWSDDWLISPQFDCSATGGTYTLSYWHYYNDYSTGSLDSGRVLVSIDGGTNWQTVAMYSNADDQGYREHDITGLVMGQSNVKVGFHYVANDEMYWYVDDFVLDFAADTTGPAITAIEQPENTYLAGPYTVTAEITDASGVLADSLYYIIDDLVTAVSHTSVAGDTFSYEIPTQVPGTVIEYYVGAVDNLMNESASDRYSFWRLSPMAPSDLEVAGQADSTVQLDWLPPGEELSYHGTVYYYWSWNIGDRIATQFTPQHTPCKLEAASITFFSVADTVEVHVWADDGYGNPGADLYVDTVIISQVYPNAEIFDLSAADIVVDGDFHVGLFWLGDSTPLPTSDAGSNTTRSKYCYAGGGWEPLGCDWLMSAVVSYIPPTPFSARSASRVEMLTAKNKTGRAEAGDDMVMKSRLSRGLVEPLDVAAGPGLLERILGISNFEVERSETQGGPYTSLGTTSQSPYIDSTVASETRYYYVAKANYTAPDTVSYYSNEVTIGVDFNPPAYSNTTYDSLVGGPWLVSTDITDWIGLAYDSLAYRADGGAFAYVVSDSVSGNTYYYTIPSYPSYTLIEFYMFSQDTSWMQNVGQDPLTGYYEFTVTGIAEYKLGLIPDRVFLSQNRPNPFSQLTLIEYGVPRNMHVSISVYNAAGQRVKTLVNEAKAPGYYVVNWQGTDDLGRRLAEGVYFMRITTDDLRDTKKIIHVR